MSENNIKKAFTSAIENARLGIFTQLNAGVVPPQAIVVQQFKTLVLFNLKLTFSGVPSINTAFNVCSGVSNSPVLWNCN